MVLKMRPQLDRSVLGHHRTSQMTRRRQCPQCVMSRHLLLACICQQKVTQSNMRPPRTSTGHKNGSPWATTSAAVRTVRIAHLFSWTVLTRSKNKVITFFLFCLASIDATLTTIVGDRLLPYWYSTIAAGGICVLRKLLFQEIMSVVYFI